MSLQLNHRKLVSIETSPTQASVCSSQECLSEYGSDFRDVSSCQSEPTLKSPRSALDKPELRGRPRSSTYYNKDNRMSRLMELKECREELNQSQFLANYSDDASNELPSHWKSIRGFPVELVESIKERSHRYTVPCLLIMSILVFTTDLDNNFVFTGQETNLEFFLSFLMQSIGAVFVLLIFSIVHTVVISATIMMSIKDFKTFNVDFSTANLSRVLCSVVIKVSGGIVAFSTSKAIIRSTLITCYLFFRFLYSEVIDLQNAIVDSTKPEITSGWTGRIIVTLVRIVSFIFSPIFRYMGWLIVKTSEIPSTKYSFWKYAVDDAGNWMLSTTLLILFFVFLGQAFLSREIAEGKDDNKVVVILDDDNKLANVDELFSIAGTTSDTKSTRSNGKKNRFKKLKKIFSKRKGSNKLSKGS